MGRHMVSIDGIKPIKNGYFGHTTDQTLSKDDLRDRHIKEILLSSALYSVRNVSGIDKWLENKRNSDPESLSPEILVMSQYVRMGGTILLPADDVQLAGKNHEFDVVMNNQTLHVEVKCKMEDAEPSRKGLINALKGGITQLPAQGPGILAMYIPKNWGAGVDGLSRDLKEESKELFRRSKRVSGIIFFGRSEWWHPEREDFIAATIIKEHYSDDCRTPVFPENRNLAQNPYFGASWHHDFSKLATEVR